MVRGRLSGETGEETNVAEIEKGSGDVMGGGWATAHGATPPLLCVNASKFWNIDMPVLRDITPSVWPHRGASLSSTGHGSPPYLLAVSLSLPLARATLAFIQPTSLISPSDHCSNPRNRNSLRARFSHSLLQRCVFGDA